MPCETIVLRDEHGSVIGGRIICSSDRRATCRFCRALKRSRPARYLCDGVRDTSTCNAPLCEGHALEVGPDQHLCPPCDRARATPLVVARFE